MRSLNGYLKPVVGLAPTPDGARLYTACSGQTHIWVWDLQTCQVIQKRSIREASPSTVQALACSPRGDRLVFSTDHVPIFSWRLDGSDTIDQHPPSPGVPMNPRLLTFHPNGRVLAAGGAGSVSNGIQIWDLTLSLPGAILPVKAPYLLDLAYTPDGMQLVTASYDRTVRFWDASNGHECHRLEHDIKPTQIALRPDGSEIATVCGWKVHVWKIQEQPAMRATLKNHGGPITDLAYSPDGKYLASISQDGSAALYDAQTLELVGLRYLEIGALAAIAWLAGGEQVVVGGAGPIVLCERAELQVTQKRRGRGEGEPLSFGGQRYRVECLAYSPDGTMLATLDRDSICTWDLSQGVAQARSLAKISISRNMGVQLEWCTNKFLGCQCHAEVAWYEAQTGSRHAGPRRDNPCCVRVAPDGRQFLGSSAQGMYTLEDSSGKVIATVKAPHRYISSVVLVAFPARGEHIYLAERDNVVYRWTLATGTLEQIAKESARLIALAVSPDENFLIGCAGRTVHVWSLPSGAKHTILRHPHTVTGAAFLADGRLLTVCQDKHIRVWQVSNAQEVVTIDPGMGKLYCLALSPDGMTFAVSVEKRNRIIVMDVPD